MSMGVLRINPKVMQWWKCTIHSSPGGNWRMTYGLWMPRLWLIVGRARPLLSWISLEASSSRMRLKKTHNGYNVAEVTSCHENQQFNWTTPKAWLLSLVKINGSLLLKSCPLITQEWFLGGLSDPEDWYIPINSDFLSTQHLKWYNTGLDRND